MNDVIIHNQNVSNNIKNIISDCNTHQYGWKGYWAKVPISLNSSAVVMAAATKQRNRVGLCDDLELRFGWKYHIQ